MKPADRYQMSDGRTGIVTAVTDDFIIHRQDGHTGESVLFRLIRISHTGIDVKHNGQWQPLQFDQETR